MGNPGRDLSNCKAMILAAGEGQRLRPLTDDRPKPMLTVGFAPILEYNVRLLARHGIRQIAINLHHRPSVISDHFGDGSKFHVQIRYSKEPELLGTAGAVKRMGSFFDQPFFVLYGDNLTDISLSRMFQQHQATDAFCTVALFSRSDTSASGVADMAEDLSIRRFIEKPPPNTISSHWVNAGVLLFEPQVLDYIPGSSASDFGRDIIPALISDGRRVLGYPMTENLLWIDSPEDHARTCQMVHSGDPSTAFLRNEVVE
jgi:mannose-1-phosphate guanylyltransferase